MKKKKITFIIVNRANYGRIKNLLIDLKKKEYFKIDIVIVSSSTLKKYGEIENVIKKDGLKVSEKIYTHIEGENLHTMAKSTGLLLLELSTTFQKLNPDMVFIVGDRYEVLSAAIAANYMNIFLIHLQGGELTGSVDENVRHAVTKLSHLHLVNTNRSKKIVQQMGENPKNVFNVGCPSIDIIKNLDFKKVKIKQPFGVGHKIDLKKPYYVFLIHPVTTDYKNSEKLINEMIEVAKKINDQIIWLWPNVDAGAHIFTKKIRSFREKYKKKINFVINFKTDEYLKIIKNCIAIIGNSSSAIREASYMGIQAINIGDRQILRERSKNVIDAPVDHKHILRLIKKSDKIKIKGTKLYGDGNAISKIINILRKTNLDIKKKFYVK